MQPFTIPLKSLKVGVNRFEWHADGEFFGTFENSEISDADLEIVLKVYFDNDSIKAECKIDGSVVVECDRCLEPLTLDVHTSFEEDGYELDKEIDFSQDIYDYVCTSLPMQKVHPEGQCNPETVKYLSK